MADPEVFPMIVGSGGSGVFGNPSRFTVQLPLPIHLRGKWQAAVRSLSWPKSTVSNSVFVYCDIIEPSIINGSLQPVLFKTRPVLAADPAQAYVEEASTLPIWHNVDAPSLSQLTIWIQESTGTAISTSGVAVLEILFRKISD
jgi:hypothetical protein